MNAYETIKKDIEVLFKDLSALSAQAEQAGGITSSFSLDQPEDITHGEYATNVAFVLGKNEGISPKDTAEKYAPILQERLSSLVEKVEVAGPGFINFFLKKEVLLAEVEKTAKQFLDTINVRKKRLIAPRDTGAMPDQAKLGLGKVMVEYTDPNCFKVFHIGHLMSNAIGEAVSRIYEAAGYEVTRLCYPSDIGRNVAMGVWGVMQKEKEKPKEEASLKDKITFLGMCYAFANDQYESNEIAKQEIMVVNKAIYEGADTKIMEVYTEGRGLSLEYFNVLYKRLGTTFGAFIFESEVAEPGLALVKEFLKKGLFEESEGAVVYKGEQDGLHTRVFVTAQGIPTYEAKDLGNYEKKLKLLPGAEKYVVITANEQNDYFKVINTVAQKIHPELSGKLVHIGHGLLRLPGGKMSSRKGNVVSAEDLINEIKGRLLGITYEAIDKTLYQLEHSRTHATATFRLSDGQDADNIAIGAIKFSILKQAPGKDTVFDLEKSISFEGDSGPYLQYTHARMHTLLEKVKEMGIESSTENDTELGYELSRLLLVYPQILAKAYNDIGPHHIVNYLLLLTRAFNSLYGATQFLDTEKKESGYYVMLTEASRNILAHGLHTLGIIAPQRM